MLNNHQRTQARARLAAARDFSRGKPMTPNASPNSAWAEWYAAEYRELENVPEEIRKMYVDEKIIALCNYLLDTGNTRH